MYTEEALIAYFAGRESIERKRKEIDLALSSLEPLMEEGLGRKPVPDEDVILSVSISLNATFVVKGGRTRGISFDRKQGVVMSIESGNGECLYYWSSDSTSNKIPDWIVPPLRAALDQIVTKAAERITDAGIGNHFDFFIKEGLRRP